MSAAAVRFDDSRMNERPLSAVALVLALVLASVGTVPVAAGERATIERRVTVTPVDADTVSVELRYAFPDPVEQFAVTVYDPTRTYGDATVTGFERSDSRPGSNTYVWSRDGAEGSTATVSYRVDLPRDTYPQSAVGVAGDGWQFLELPSTGVRWTSTAPVGGVEETAQTGGASGVVTGRYAYLGPSTERTARAGDQTIHLVVPDAASPTPSTSAVLSSLVRGARRFPDVDADPDVYAFALPASVETPGRVGRGGGNALWVRADAAPRGPKNPWLHEYVHTQQNGSVRGGSGWFAEASAEYYAASLSASQNGTTYARARESVGSVSDRDAVLANRSTWASARVPYGKGARVLAALDARLRARTNGSTTLLDVFAAVYDGDSASPAAVRDAIARHLGPGPADAFVERYVAGEDLPPMPESYLFTFAPDGDPDDDGLSNRREHRARTSPFGVDTDGDGLADPQELAGPTNATLADTDGDGLDDGQERSQGTASTDPDTDGDGVADGEDAFPTDPERAHETSRLAVIVLLLLAGLSGAGIVAVVLARVAARLGYDPGLVTNVSVSRLLVVLVGALAVLHVYTGI